MTDASDVEGGAIGGAFDDDDDVDEAKLEAEKEEFMEVSRIGCVLDGLGMSVCCAGNSWGARVLFSYD